jgi:hypothetical protein
MLLVLACPHCSDAYERETRSYHEPQAYDDCGALLQMAYNIEANLMQCCRACGSVFEGAEGQTPPMYGRPRYPACGVEPGCPDEEDELPAEDGDS